LPITNYRQFSHGSRGLPRIVHTREQVRLYNFELALMWGEAEARVHMRTNRTVDVLKEATARSKEIANAAALRDLGFVDHAAATRSLGISE
jgi:hypothetical protein